MESISIETSTILGDAESMDAVISEVRKGRLDNTTMRRLVHWILARRRTHGACSIPRPQERRPRKDAFGFSSERQGGQTAAKLTAGDFVIVTAASSSVGIAAFQVAKAVGATIIA